jgi:hypothetical protein
MHLLNKYTYLQQDKKIVLYIFLIGRQGAISVLLGVKRWVPAIIFLILQALILTHS